VPAVLAIWITPPPALSAHILETADPAAQAPDRAFASAAAVLMAGVFVLGILYHPITDVIRAGVSLL